MKKTIVALYGSSGRGKSTALKKFIHQLKKNKNFDFKMCIRDSPYDHHESLDGWLE